MRKTSRREFIRQLAFAGGGRESRSHTLVCVFLRGGADTLNLLVPWGDDNYYRLRPTISVPAPAKGGANKQAALRLDDFYGLHPLLEPLLPIFQEGRLGVVPGVGSDNPTGSHFDPPDPIEHGEAYGRTIGGGWLGRHLRPRGRAGTSPLAALAPGANLPRT